VVELRRASFPGRLLLRCGLLVDPDLHDLDGGGVHQEGAAGVTLGGNAALAFVFKLVWRICI
jgi:hypothetical protein